MNRRLTQLALLLAFATLTPTPAMNHDWLRDCRKALERASFAALGEEIPAEIWASAKGNEEIHAALKGVWEAKTPEQFLLRFNELQPLTAVTSFLVGEHLSHSDNPALRTISAVLMANNRAHESIEPLRRLLSDPVAKVRAAALDELTATIWDPPLKEIRHLAASDPDPATREKARQLANDWDPDYLRSLLQAAQGAPPFWAYHRLEAQQLALTKAELFAIASKVGKNDLFVSWLDVLVNLLADDSPLIKWSQDQLMSAAMQGEHPVLAHLAMATLFQRGLSDKDTLALSQDAQFAGVKRAAAGLGSNSLENLRLHLLFSSLSEEKWRNLAGCPAICSEQFTKSGTQTHLLGGKLLGKAIVRIIPETAAQAWEKALGAKEVWERAGFAEPPIEPILQLKDIATANGLTASETQMLDQWLKTPVAGHRMILTGVLPGSSFGHLRSGYFLGKSLDTEIEQTTNRIRKVVSDDLGIEHGHDHEGNFVVCLQDHTQVTLIDFDQATIRAAAPPKK